MLVRTIIKSYRKTQRHGSEENLSPIAAGLGRPFRPLTEHFFVSKLFDSFSKKKMKENRRSLRTPLLLLCPEGRTHGHAWGWVVRYGTQPRQSWDRCERCPEGRG